MRSIGGVAAAALLVLGVLAGTAEARHRGGVSVHHGHAINAWGGSRRLRLR